MQQRMKNSKGLAFTTILLAVVLIAAITVSIAMSARSGTASTSQQQDKLLATTLINQAQQIKTSMEIAMSNGLDLSTVTISWTAPVTTFDMGAYGPIAQVAPVNATTNPGSFGWLWHGSGALAKIKNVGTGAGNYVLEIDPLTAGVCQQINQALFGSTAILTSYANGWSNPQPVDASTENNLDSKQEGCFYSSVFSRYFYYKVVLVQ
jgi:hypothetical protein